LGLGLGLGLGVALHLRAAMVEVCRVVKSGACGSL
jgi:hypothetical protein